MQALIKAHAASSSSKSWTRVSLRSSGPSIQWFFFWVEI